MNDLLEIAAIVLTAAIPFVPVFRRARVHRRRRAARRALLQLPETQVAAVKDGEKVRIKGRAAAREPLRTSPVSQRRCIGYRLTVDVEWHTLLDDNQMPSFVLADDTGEAVIHPPLEIDLAPFRESQVLAASPALASRLGTVGVTASDLFGKRRAFRYVETILMPGDELIAIGRGTIEVDQAGRAPSHREPPVMCHLRGADGPVVIVNAQKS